MCLLNVTGMKVLEDLLRISCSTSDKNIKKSRQSILHKCSQCCLDVNFLTPLLHTLFVVYLSSQVCQQGYLGRGFLQEMLGRATTVTTLSLVILMEQIPEKVPIDCS